MELTKKEKLVLKCLEKGILSNLPVRLISKIVGFSATDTKSVLNTIRKFEREGLVEKLDRVFDDSIIERGYFLTSKGNNLCTEVHKELFGDSDFDDLLSKNHG